MAMSQVDPCYPDAKSVTSFQDGLEYQDFVCVQLAQQGIILQNLASRRYQFEVGENLQGFEIKKDDRCTETLRLSIEVAEKTRNDPSLGWTPSGIFRSDNSWLYVQGNYSIIFVFAKNLLVKWQEKYRPPLTDKFGTVKTFYMPFSVARKLAAKVIDVAP